MTFLQLAKRLRQEAGIAGTGPTTVASQSGEMLQVVDWISAAYETIQNAHTSWRFLRNDFSFSTVAGTQSYTPATIGATSFADWIREDMRIYLTSVADEQFLEYSPWDEFRVAYLFGSNRTVQGRPVVVTVKPNNSLALWQLPDAVYTVTGEYYKTPDVLSGDSDTPIIPTRFHMIIVWRALMDYGAFQAADEKYAHGQNEYTRLMRMMELDQLEDFLFGDPLA